jgi:hypothetical protein
MTQLKSLAHPEWPYAGTAHEWRGFVKSEKKAAPVQYEDQMVAMQNSRLRGIYQKQNFGPDLD